MISQQTGRSLKCPALEIGGRRFEWGQRTFLMGIVNLTPDSFSGDGLVSKAAPGKGSLVELALQQGRAMAASGADILDVGGESTRPGAQPVNTEGELARVIPVIKALKEEIGTLISVDTYKAPVAEAALQAGAHIVNDVWGLRADPSLAEVVSRREAAIILMHNRSSWAQAEIKEGLGGRYIGAPYVELIPEICAELTESVEIAKAAGIPDEHIILDPGIGFGKTTPQNLELVNQLERIRALGYPILAGPSRKSFIGYTLNLPPEERLEGTAAAATICIARGADILRVHDLPFMARVARMADAIVRPPLEN